MCIVGQKNCNNVVNSKYNTLFGVHNEALGMIYYGLIALIYLFSFLFPIFQSNNVIYGIYAITGGAAIFSVYLTFVQIFKLKEYCEWCFVSAGISVLIFGLMFF